MIESVRYKNFKSLRSARLDLERLTVIVGPNASGKTSLLQGLDCMSQSMRAGRVSPDRFDVYQPGELRSRGAEAPLELAWNNSGTETLLTAVPRGNGWEYLWEIRPANSKTAPIERIQSTTRLTELSLPSSLLRLDPSKLAAPTTKSRQTGFRLDGAGFASALTDTALIDPDLFQKIQFNLGRIIPNVKRVRIRRHVADKRKKAKIASPTISDQEVFVEVTYEQLVFDMDGAPDLPATLVSEGTLLVLGLLATLLGPSRPKLLLLDDIDRALHPKAQRELVGLLREFLKQDPELQIVATSHSPYLLDQLRPQEVRLTTIREDGSSVCGSLVDHPDFDRWKDEMAPGEMWSFFGEEWVANLKTAGN